MKEMFPSGPFASYTALTKPDNLLRWGMGGGGGVRLI